MSDLENGQLFEYVSGPDAHEKHIHISLEKYAEMQAKLDILREEYEELKRSVGEDD